MNENFIVIDATDDIVIGGFGNLEGNLSLLKYSYEEISQKMKENNNKEDDIRLVNSLLDSIRKLQQENQKYKEVIDKAIEYINEYAWQEDIIGDMFTVTGKPMIDKYMQLDWDNCNELLDILKGVE